MTRTNKTILTLLANGNTRSEVSTRIGYSETTVKRRVEEMRQEFGAKNITHLVALYLTRGEGNND